VRAAKFAQAVLVDIQLHVEALAFFPMRFNPVR
jgi:hypothetical protein